ncbi:MAG: photosystem II S4 domain protein [Cyanobacteriota bacterium]|nr:photosystem II S4 domain protein [Cyanobacteriota bacterium]
MQASVLALAEAAQRSWQPQWTGFLDGGAQELALQELGSLSDLTLHRWGGFDGAERQRLLLVHAEVDHDSAALGNQDLEGLDLLGNFLFDPAEPADFRQALCAAGIAEESLGDIWLRGDRGAQAVALGSTAQRLDGLELQVRSVATLVQRRPLASLQPPPPRKARRFSSVEASLRLDAVGSAGFGVSRSRMAELIRSGAVRINWQPTTSPSRELRCGDRVQLQHRGELVLESAELTQKQRWRVGLTRC